jgi:hypothetical protein
VLRGPSKQHFAAPDYQSRCCRNFNDRHKHSDRLQMYVEISRSWYFSSAKSSAGSRNKIRIACMNRCRTSNKAFPTPQKSRNLKRKEQYLFHIHQCIGGISNEAR